MAWSQSGALVKDPNTLKKSVKMRRMELEARPKKMWLEDECLFGKASFYAGGHVCFRECFFLVGPATGHTPLDSTHRISKRTMQFQSWTELKRRSLTLCCCCCVGVPRLLFFVEATWSWMISIFRLPDVFFFDVFWADILFPENHKIQAKLPRMRHIAQPNSQQISVSFRCQDSVKVSACQEKKQVPTQGVHMLWAYAEVQELSVRLSLDTCRSIERQRGNSVVNDFFCGLSAYVGRRIRTEITEKFLQIG